MMMKKNTYTSFASAWQTGVSTKSQIKVALKHSQQNVGGRDQREKWGWDIVGNGDVNEG